MSAGHHHGGERAASALADQYYDSAAPLVAACTVDRSCDVPWLANRSRNLKTVYVDRRVPNILKCGIDTDLSLPWHEIPEGQAMDEGLPYDEGTPSAHCDVATPLERREVERQKPDDPDIWAKYTDEMDGLIRAVDDESIERVPLDMDLRVFAEDDRALLEEIIAAQQAEKSSPLIVRAPMPQILKPADVVARLKAGETREQIFLDASGGVKAKLIGPQATIRAVGDEGSRTIDFVISTESIDRYDSTIKLGGWKLANYRRNPVVLWGHDDFTPPIGRGSVRTEGNALCSMVEFAPGEIYPLAETIYQLVVAKFINAASVGFMPLAYEWANEDERPYGVDFTEQELLEWSVVSIPANPDCLVQARSVGIDCAPIIAWAERTLDRGGMTVIARAELEALRKSAGAATIGRPARAGSIDWDKITLLPEALDELSATLRASVAGGATASAQEKRKGRVISAENEKRLQTAHDHVKAANDHCTAAMDHVRAVIDQVRDAEDGDPCDPEDPDCDPTADDPEQNAAAAEAQRQRVRVLRLKGGRTAAAA